MLGALAAVDALGAIMVVVEVIVVLIEVLLLETAGLVDFGSGVLLHAAKARTSTPAPSSKAFFIESFLQ